MAFAYVALRLAVHVVRGPWFMVYAAFLIMATNGSGFLFGIYSKEVKSTLGYNQQMLNTLSFFKDLGSNISIFSGLINEVTPPSVALTISAAMNLFGYLMVYFSITGHVRRPALWQMCLYICAGANSQSFSNTSAFVTTVKNFPETRGVVVGLLKGFIGLSGAIFTQLYLTFYGDDSKSLVLLIAWLPAAVSLAFVGTIRIMKVVRQPNEFRVFCYFLYISLVLAAYLMAVIIAEKKVIFTHRQHTATTAGVLLLLLLPLVLVVREDMKLWKQKTKSIRDVPPISIVIENRTILESELEPKPEPTTKGTSEKKSVKSRLINIFKTPKRGEDYSILQAVVSIDMLILFFGTICGLGGSLTAVDNMGQIGESLGYPSRSIGTFISLISIWNYMGRVTAGFTSEILLKKYKLPRPVVFTLVLVLSCFGHSLIAFGVPGSLYVASMIIGFCLGAQNPLLYAIISELFGLKYFSTMYNVAGLAIPIALYVLNVRVAGHLYDREAAKQNEMGSTAGKSLTCMGVHCFRLSFIIITAVTAVGTIGMLVLVYRTWDFYRGDIYAKFKEREEEEKKREDVASGGVEDGKVMPVS